MDAEFFVDVLTKAAIPVCAALLAAALTAYFAFSKYIQQRQWEEKRSVYNSVINAMEEISYWGDQRRANLYCEPIHNEDISINKNLRILARLSVTSTLFVSDEYLTLFSKAYEEIGAIIYADREEGLGLEGIELSNHEAMHACRIRDTADRYLKQLIKMAKKDMP